MAQSGYQKGICDVCRMPVFVDEARSKNQWGGYVHAQCVAGAGEARVGVAGVTPTVLRKTETKDVKGSPTVLRKTETKDVKGICNICRLPVFVDHARSKNQWGAYVHAQCVAREMVVGPSAADIPWC